MFNMKEYKKYTLIAALIILSVFSLNGCTKRKNNEPVTEEIVKESSGTDSYHDINEDINPHIATTSTPQYEEGNEAEPITNPIEVSTTFSLDDVPDYNGEAILVINNDVPYFNESDLTTECYCDFGTLDELGRTQGSVMVTGKEKLPDGDRGEIGHIKPSGWHQHKYPGIIETEPPYAMQRAHLCMWAMWGDETNVQENLISGFEYFNKQMLENEMIALNYIKGSDYHILYRVTPYYKDDELLARGVLMEAISVEDKGESLRFCRWVYNVQPGLKVDYSTGENEAE